MQTLKQSSTAKPLIFFLYDSADHVTGKTGVTPTVTISKNGAAFASPSGSVTEISNGFYKVAGNATDTNTLGMLALNATGTGCDQCTMAFEVVLLDPDTAAITAGTGTGQLSVSSGQVILQTGTGTGQLDFTSGVVKSNLAQILGTVLTETAGLLAGGFKKFFNIATPASTMDAVNLAATQSFNNTGQTTKLAATIAAGDIAANAVDASALKADAATEIATAVRDINNTSPAANSLGAAINSAASAGDPWSTDLPGAYSSGTAGYIVGTLIPAINAKTTNLPPDPADASDLAAAFTVVGSAITALPTPPTAAANALALLKYDWSGITGEASFSALNALRFVRGNWSISGSTLSVFKEDGVTPAYTHTLTTDATAVPIVGIS